MTKKELINKELELYRQREILKIDRDIHARKVNNWKSLDEVRRDTGAEIAKLEAKKELLKELSKVKDNEIKSLKKTISDLISNLPTK